MLTKPIVEALRDEVAQRFEAAGGGALDLEWIVPRAERGRAALAVVVRTTSAPEVLDGGLWNVELVAVCAVGGSEDAAFETLDLLQHSVAEVAADPPRDVGDGRLFGIEVRGSEWGEAEQGDVRLCEVRLVAKIVTP